MKTFLCVLAPLIITIPVSSPVFADSGNDVIFEDASGYKGKKAELSGPVRHHRNFALTAEIPWNGLAGLGPMIHYYAHPHFCLDMGTGLAGTGLKFGFRARGIFSKSPVAPFAGIGFMSGGGTGNVAIQLNTADNPITIKLARTNFIQMLGGVDIVTEGGFMFLGGFGYAACLNRDNVTVVEGIPTDLQEKAFDIAYRGGLVLSLNFGYAFKLR